MKSHIINIIRLLSVASVLLAAAACQDKDEILTQEENSVSADFPYSYQLQLNLANEDTRAGEKLDWKDGDRIYLGFSTENGYIYGQGVYAASDDNWKLSLESAMTSGQGSVHIKYSPDLSPSALEKDEEGRYYLNLTEETCLYDGWCQYNVNQGVVFISGSISPACHRIRFQGTAGTKITFEVLEGLGYYTRVHLNGGGWGTSYSSKTIEIGKDGYSPYLYTYDSNFKTKITVNGTKNYYREESELNPSSCFVAPTETNAHGWQPIENFGDFEYTVDAKTQTAILFKYHGEEEVVNVPATVFYNRKDCAITTIERDAFRDNRNITQVNLPNTITSIKNYAFNGCNNLKEISLQEGLKEIGWECFSYSGLEGIDLPESVTNLSGAAFWCCSSLKEAKLPSSLTNIPDQLFGYCRSLEKITIPENVTYIDYNAFRYCEGLRSIQLPKKLVCIRDRVFEGCKNLESIYCSSTTVPYCLYSNEDLNSFKDVPSSVLVYVHPSRVDEYKSAPGWNRFTNIQGNQGFGNEQLQQPNAIDLGLPSGTLWADRNVNALTPEDAGGYYSWGDSQRKSYYDRDTYKYWNAATDTFSKYTETDGKLMLEDQDDVATIIYGKTWKSPTYEEMEELLNRCTWSKQTQNGREGFQVTGPNGKSIFLPLCGYIRGSYFRYENTRYMLCNLYTSYNFPVLHYYQDEDRSYFSAWGNNDGRYYGFLLRPVAVQ